jgi:hypothetical protein
LREQSVAGMVFQVLRDLCAYSIDALFFDGPIFSFRTRAIAPGARKSLRMLTALHCPPRRSERVSRFALDSSFKPAACGISWATRGNSLAFVVSVPYDGLLPGPADPLRRGDEADRPVLFLPGGTTVSCKTSSPSHLRQPVVDQNEEILRLQILRRARSQVARDLLKGQILVLIACDWQSIPGRRENGAFGPLTNSNDLPRFTGNLPLLPVHNYPGQSSSGDERPL